MMAAESPSPLDLEALARHLERLGPSIDEKYGVKVSQMASLCTFSFSLPLSQPPPYRPGQSKSETSQLTLLVSCMCKCHSIGLSDRIGV